MTDNTKKSGIQNFTVGNTQETWVLYHNPFSLCSRKVRFCLDEYKIEYKSEPIDLIETGKYGVAEKSFLKINPSAKNYFKIASKGIIARSSDGKTFFDNSKEYLTNALEASLKRLGVENLELYYVHRRDQSIPIEEVTETLAGFVKQGKINQFGYSEIAPTSLEKANNIHPVGAVQSEYSLSTRYPELGLLQKTKSLKTSFVAFSPVGRSLLTDKPHTEEMVKEMPFLM